MSITSTPTDWSYPEVRPGLPGLLDRAIGPGHTRAELILQLTFPLGAAIAIPVMAMAIELPWTIGQQVLAAFLAFDGVGGVITNSTSSGKRWFHRPGQGPAKQMSFVMLHFIHLSIVAYVFAAGSLQWFIGAAAFLTAAAAALIHTPTYLQRPLAGGFVAMGFIYSSYCLPIIEGLQWLLPVFYLKLLGAHLVREEPYRPCEPTSALNLTKG